MNNICSMTFGSSIIFIVGLYHAHFLYIGYNCCVFIDKLSMALASFSDFLTWSNSSFDWLVHFLLPYVFTPYRSVFWISHVCLFLVNAMRRELMVWTLDFFSLVLWSVCLFTPWDVRCPKVLHLSESNALPCKPQRKRPVTKNLSLQISSLKNTLPESIPPLPGLLTTPGIVNPKNFVAFQASSRHSAYVNSWSGATATSFSNSIARNFANANAIPSGLLPLSYTPTLSHTPHFVTLPLLPSTICAPDGPDPIPPSHRVSPPSSSSPQHYSYAGVYPHDAPPLL